MKPKIKALFFDIDGTLVGLKNHRLNETDIESLRRLKEEGYLLFIATGRDFLVPDEISVLEPLFPYLTGYIDINGQHSALMDGTEIFNLPIADEDFLPLRKSCEEHHLSMLYRHENANYISEMTEHVAGYWNWWGFEIPAIRPLEGEIHNIPRLCIHCSAEEEERFITPLLKQSWTARITPDLVDLVPYGAGKDSGIRKICEYFGIDITETMGFGDGQNDLGMLNTVGIAVAMENAADNVKAAADFVTSTTEEAGITLALRHFGLI